MAIVLGWLTPLLYAEYLAIRRIDVNWKWFVRLCTRLLLGVWQLLLVDELPPVRGRASKFMLPVITYFLIVIPLYYYYPTITVPMAITIQPMSIIDEHIMILLLFFFLSSINYSDCRHACVQVASFW